MAHDWFKVTILYRSHGGMIQDKHVRSSKSISIKMVNNIYGNVLFQKNECVCDLDYFPNHDWVSKLLHRQLKKKYSQQPRHGNDLKIQFEI